MFSRKSDDKKKKKDRPRDDARLAQMGLLGVGGMEDLGITVPDDDPALEDELLALLDEDTPTNPRHNARGGGGAPPSTLPAPLQELDRMVAECLDDNDEVEVTSDDEDDPALMEELMGLSGGGGAPRPAPVPLNEPVIQRTPPAAAGASVLHLLKERLATYERAEAQATLDGESSRARRFARGLKTLQQMKKSVEAGKAIKEEDIPPEIVVRSAGPRPPAPPVTDQPSSSPPTPATPARTVALEEESVAAPPASVPQPRPASSLPHSVAFPSDTDTAQPSSPTVQRLELLQAAYRAAALQAKQRGAAQDAIAYLRITKQLQPLLQAAREGQPVDMASLPPMPGEAPPEAPKAESRAQAAPSPAAKSSEGDGGDELQGSPALPTVAAGSVLGALQERRAKYAEQFDKAKEAGNTRKERMNQRILKQYDDALKRHKAGKPVQFDELPTPPGFPPLPTSAPVPSPAAPAPAAAPVAAAAAASDGPSPPKMSRPQPAQPQPKANVRSAPKSRVERQMSVLVKRQEQFKAAALDAKKRGEMEQAKEYLRNSKGFNTLIEATTAGLPVDMNTVPIPPQEQASGGPSLRRELSVDPAFEVINAEDCLVPASDTPADLAVIYTKLEEDLVQQIKMCATTREHFKAVGDVASSNRFEQLIVHCKKDLDAVRLSFKRGDKPPRCHYENRSFSIVQCNTDLNDSDCQVNVVRGINYNVQNPTDVDTFVKIEFPYPTDNSPQDRSGVVKDTNNPVYEHSTLFSIDRKSRALARCFGKKAVKLTVHAKGGWFRSDTIVGIAKVPLVQLENTCTIHDSFDLNDERKKMVGGKLEVKIRVRNPILNKEIKQVNEKWLVIDGF